MKNLIFSLNATVPVFLLMALGFLFRKLGWLDEVFASKMNQFVFLVPLPLLVFEDLASVDFQKVWNLKFVLFCFFVTLASIALAGILSLLWKDRGIRGEFIQASYRSSAALLGIAFIQNIYGDAGLAPLMIIGSVPLYNMMAVVVLSFFQPEQRKRDKLLWKKTLKGIVTNPIIIGIAAGLFWSALRIPMPYVIEKTVSNIGAVATPLGLMALGASFDVQKALGKIKPVIAAYCCRRSKHDENRDQFFSAKSEHHRKRQKHRCKSDKLQHTGTLTSGVVMLTTVFSAFTLTGWLFILKSMNLV